MRVQAPSGALTGVLAGALGGLCRGLMRAQKDPARRIHSQDAPGGVNLSRGARSTQRECLAISHHDLAGGTALHLREGVVHERVRARL